MNEIKFLCPHCQQRIQCDASYAGRKIPCPTCKTELRIPQAVDKPAKSVNPKSEVSPPPPSAPAGKSKPPPGAEPAAEGTKPAPAKLEPGRTTLRCLCPVCDSELEISLPSGGPKERDRTAVQPAKVVREGKAQTVSSAAAGGTAAATPAGVGDGPGQIKNAKPAKAKPAKAPHPGAQMKPRLSYILTGKPPSPVAYEAPKRNQVPERTRAAKGKAPNQEDEQKP